MALPQFSLRLPVELDERVKEFAAAHFTTKSQVMIDALHHYLGLSGNVPVPERLEALEKRMAQLEAKVEG